MDLLGNIFSDLIVGSIGWTLLHSLWQGLVVSIILSLFMVIFKDSGAHVRYRIGVCLLAVMVLVSLVTFLMVYRAGIEQNPLEESSVGMRADSLDNRSGEFFTYIKIYFQRNLPAVVTIWLIGMMFFFMKFVSGMLANQRLRHHQTSEVSEFWKYRVESLCRKLKIRPAIIFRESFMAAVPLTIGYLKPVILFPVGILSQIPPDQAEALIVHELAHILRRDYIVNIFQNIVDIVYFYHPGIRWISRRVRSERENCCDDITVDLVGDSLNYARALTRAGEFSLKCREGLAMSASGDSSRLLKRIRRLFTMKKERSKPKDGIFGFLLMVLFAVSLVLGLNAGFRLFAGAAEPGDAFGENYLDTEKEEVRRLMERHEKLAARERLLTEDERKEMKEIDSKLAAVKEMAQEKKLQSLISERERLEARARRTEAENQELKKLNELLTEHRHREQYQFKVKNEKMVRKPEELKTREDDLSEKEMRQLRLLQVQLKEQQEMEFRRQLEIEIERKAAYEEQQKMEKEVQIQLEKQERLEEERSVLIEKERQVLEEERRLKEFELQALIEKQNRNHDEEKKLKEQQVKKYLEQQELKKVELKKEYEHLIQEIDRLVKKGKLTEEEKNALGKLREKQNQIKQTLDTVH